MSYQPYLVGSLRVPDTGGYNGITVTKVIASESDKNPIYPSTLCHRIWSLRSDPCFKMFQVKIPSFASKSGLDGKELQKEKSNYVTSL